MSIGFEFSCRISKLYLYNCFVVTQVKFNITDDTTLADLLALNLHKYEEEVKTIVDKSVKEAAMEKTLK